MSLLKNRKGMDYSAFLVIVVFIVCIYLFVQLSSKINVFALSVGDQELALMNAYGEGDKLLLFVDQSAKYAVFDSVRELASNGGFAPGSEPCGSVGPVGVVVSKHSFWVKEGKKCYSDVNVYDSFDSVLSGNLNSFLLNSPFSVFKNNFEFVVDDSKVMGIAVKPVLIPVLVSPENRLSFSSILVRVADEFGVAGTGVYAVRPSFSVDAQTLLDNYELVQDQVDVLLDCVKTGSLDACVKSSNSDDFKWAYQQVTGSSVFVFAVRLNKFVDPFSKDPVYIKFALHLPGVRVQ